MDNSNISIVPMSLEERSQLKMNKRSAVRWYIFKAMMFALFILSILVYVGLYNVWKHFVPIGNPDKFKIIIVLVSTILSIGILSVLYFKDAEKVVKNKTLDPIQLDLDAGVVQIHTLDVVRNVEIVELEDEGAGFFIELLDGRVLCVIGQDLYEYVTNFEREDGRPDLRDKFPQTKIEFRSAPQSGWRLGVKGIGKTLRPFGWVKMSRRFYKKNGKYVGPEDGVFYDGPLEAVLKRFDFKIEETF